MSKTLVTYFSRTGNTKMVAEAIYQALDGDRILLPLDKAENLDDYHLIFIGFPVQSHSVPFPVERFLKSLPVGKQIAFFSTHGSVPELRMAAEALEYAAVLTSHCRLLGTFHCRGKLSFQALEAFARSPEHKEWSEMAPSAASHPDKHDLAEAALFAVHMKARSARPDEFPHGGKAGA
ncbi:MAG: flavodoxin family protein [Candidatus Aminicenantales bacterium]